MISLLNMLEYQLDPDPDPYFNIWELIAPLDPSRQPCARALW